jgi:signal transduction histidine kinase
MPDDAGIARRAALFRIPIIMLRFVRRSLLGKLLGVYLLFVAVVLGTGLAVGTIVRRLDGEVRASDRALARAIALETDTKLRNAQLSLEELARLESVRSGDLVSMAAAFRAFRTARPDIDRVYWLDARGIMQVSVPTDVRTLGTDFSQERVFRRVRASGGQVVEAGVVDLTTYNAVATIAQPIRADSGALLGVVATNLSLDDMCVPLRTIVDEQSRQGQRVEISMLSDHGVLIASAERERLLQPVLNELPGAANALAGQLVSTVGPGRRGQEWLFSAVPVPSVGWAVVVQRPAADALAVVYSFNTWLWAAALLFGAGGLLFWLVLMHGVIRPLRLLASRHRTLPLSGADGRPTGTLARRVDEVGVLARSLQQLEHNVTTRLSELHTLLETSNAVVGTLDPQIVAATIIREVRRLVDVQAVSVLVPSEQGELRALASDGHSAEYEEQVHIPLGDPNSPSALALRDGRPVQIIAGTSLPFPPISYAEGFRAVLAIPIISRHAGGVVLLVKRTRPQPFSANEIDLLLTFANYATLAWEHAVLYERSDERLREVAQENERLYRAARQEKQTLAAIMGSMSDGLLLTSVDGVVLYANPGAGAIVGLPNAALEHSHIQAVYAALRRRAASGDEADAALARLASRPGDALLTIGPEHGRQVIDLRQFDVREEHGQVIGRGLLLRDVTRERELDQLKTTLLAAVGHELRTPLAAIKGHASTLLQDDVVWSPAEQQHFLRTISDESDRLAQLVTNLLDLARIEAGLLPLDRQPWQLATLIDNACRRMTRPAPQFTRDLPPDLPPLSVDGPRIEVVLRNLFANARDYGEGCAHVSACRENDAVVVRVVDRGPGIAAEDVPYVFDRFYRARHGLHARSGGTGLGLAICKAFVEAHGGEIWAESGAGGATIAFAIPLAMVESVQPEEVGLADRGHDNGFRHHAAEQAGAV